MIPRPLTRFVGRAEELELLRTTVAEQVLTTLVGPPGVGKTRLVLRAARLLEDGYGDRCWFVDVGAVTAGEPLLPVIGAGVGAPARERDAIEGVARSIGAEPALLILDNCEQAAERVAELVLALLAACEGLRVVVASRVELRVAGERVLPLGPMRTRNDRRGLSDAARLFYDRAASRGALLQRDAAEHELIDRICARLDGLPLAIELAASRARIVSLPELLDRLGSPLEMLRAAPGRTSGGARTLAESLDSSLRACAPRERRGFAALSVFAGSFDLASAQAVLAEAGVPDALDVIDALVACSLLGTVADGGRIRYRMLVVIRAHAAEQLRGDPAQERLLREAHARRFASSGRDLEEGWMGPGQGDKLRVAELELADIREATVYALEQGRPEHLLGLVLVPAAELWWATGRLHEGLHWLRRVLRQTELGEDLRFRALMLGATFAYGLRRLDEGDRCIAELTRIVDGATSPYVRGAFAYAAGFGQVQHGRPDEAIVTLARSRGLGDGDVAYTRMSLRSRQLLVYAENLRGDDAAAARICEEILALVAGTGDLYFSSFAHQMLALYAWRRGARNDALRHARTALRSCRAFPNRPENIDLLITCALLEERWGDPRRAEILLATAAGADDVRLRPATVSARDVEDVLSAIGRRSSASSRAMGSTLAAPEAIAFALGRTVSAPGTATITFTRRETEVVQLIREGLANKQIAKTLGLSAKTVEGHISRLMTKLGATSRVQIAMRAPEGDSFRPKDPDGRAGPL